jgi:hypothetical protein
MLCRPDPSRASLLRPHCGSVTSSAWRLPQPAAQRTTRLVSMDPAAAPWETALRADAWRVPVQQVGERARRRSGPDMKGVRPRRGVQGQAEPRPAAAASPPHPNSRHSAGTRILSGAGLFLRRRGCRRSICASCSLRCSPRPEAAMRPLRYWKLRKWELLKRRRAGRWQGRVVVGARRGVHRARWQLGQRRRRRRLMRRG